MQLRRRYFSNLAAQLFFISSKNNNKNCQEMGLLSLSNLEICIKMQNGQPIAPILNTTPEQTAFWQKVKYRLDGR